MPGSSRRTHGALPKAVSVPIRKFNFSENIEVLTFPRIDHSTFRVMRLKVQPAGRILASSSLPTGEKLLQWLPIRGPTCRARTGSYGSRFRSSGTARTSDVQRNSRGHSAPPLRTAQHEFDVEHSASAARSDRRIAVARVSGHTASSRCPSCRVK